MLSRYDLDRAAVAQILHGEPQYRVEQVWQGLYGQLAEPSQLTNLSKELRSRLAEHDDLRSALSVASEQVTDDGETVKWLFELHGGRRVETVLMHYPERSTVCISSQAGCAMSCSFCATGQAGFDRQLSVGEIVEQFVWARRKAGERGLDNVVFMGMGEPLANFDRVWGAVERLHHDLGVGARHITISTVGVVPGIARLAKADLPVSLAVSLHAADDEKRNSLVPLNKRYPLATLMKACEDYFEAKGRRISFEWALIEGVNDAPVDADKLAALALPLKARVNVIPLNPTPGYLVKGSSPAAVKAFRNRLVARGVNVTIRNTRGSDIDAACGQLAAREAKPVALRVKPRRAPVGSAD